MGNTINFVGYCPDGTFKQALKSRKNPLELETFYNAVNQATGSGCCSCCKSGEVTVLYAIKPTVISLCTECLRSLSVGLTVINIGSHGAPLY